MKIKWKSLANFEDILYEYHKGIAKITINRPEVRNAFRPKTIKELQAKIPLVSVASPAPYALLAVKSPPEST